MHVDPNVVRLGPVNEDEPRRTAVEQAYHLHRDDVYRVAYAILRDPEAAADTAHDAFARAYERWDRYDPDRPLRPWLHAIVARLALDALRRLHVRERAIPRLRDVLEIAPIGPAGGAEAAMTRRETIDASLGLLTPTARAALVLRHYYGYDYAEIAALLNTSAGNVGSILSRAHAELRRHLSDDAAEDQFDRSAI
jgi:RNA polymerase sigma-70 factor, ECF subfamily